jgi:hypothetical protein
VSLASPATVGGMLTLARLHQTVSDWTAVLLMGYGVSILWWPGGHGRVFGLQRLPMLEYISCLYGFRKGL